MSKFPEYKHEKSQEWFNRALDAIPSGVYGHLGPSEGLFLPITKWPLMSDHAKGTYFWDVDGNKYLDDGYVDHADEVLEFVESVLNDEDMLIRFLSEGLVYTGNDNQYEQPNRCNIANEYFYDYDKDGNEIETPNPYHNKENYDYFYKGN